MPTHSYTQIYIHTYFIDSNPPIIPYYQNFMDSKPPIIFYIIKIRLIGGGWDGLDIIPTWNIPLYRWYCKRFPSHNSILKHQLKENLGFWHVRQLSYCVSAPNLLFYPWWSLCWESANWVSALPDQPIRSTKRVDGNARLQKQKQKTCEFLFVSPWNFHGLADHLPWASPQQCVFIWEVAVLCSWT